MRVQTIHLPLDVPFLPAKMLSAGSFKCMYENGNLRYISWEGGEVVSMIYSAVRDQKWETASYVIEDEVVQENEEGFSIKYTAVYQVNQICYKAFFDIEGKEDRISFSMKGVALNDFQTNRIGICIHHSTTACPGKKMLIKQPDGDSYEATFPELISPHQPFKRVQQMCWTITGGAQAELTFAGDVFETEDQRNWTDASYKTYSRPLELPYPYAVHEGETIAQRVTLTVTPNKSASERSEWKPTGTGELKIPFPGIGYSRPKGFRPLSDIEIALLHKIPFNQYRVEIRLDEKDWTNELATAIFEAKQLDTQLELVVFFGSGSENELKDLVAKLQGEQLAIKSILVLDWQRDITTHEIIRDVYGMLRNALPNMKTGYGTSGYFAALNRNRSEMADYDFVSFSINPQVHATDTRTLIENLAGQRDTIKTAQTFAGGKAIHVSPVTFKTRRDDGRDVDERLHSFFGAWWTVQTIKNLSAAKSITFYETVGAKGILKEKDFPGDETPSAENLVTPVYQVLATIKAFGPVCLVMDAKKDRFIIENGLGDRLILIAEE